MIISRTIHIVAATLLLLSSLVFSQSNESQTGSYVFLAYEMVVDKDKTAYVIVSDALKFADWKENSVAIKAKFAAKAADICKVWTPGIKPRELKSTIDEVNISRAEYVESYTKWNESQYNLKVRASYIDLSR